MKINDENKNVEFIIANSELADAGDYKVQLKTDVCF